MSEDRGKFWVDAQWHGDPAPEPTPEPDPAPTPDPEPTPLTEEAVEKMIQSATDRVRTEYSGKLKDSQAELDDLKKEKMSAAEVAKFELEKLKEANAVTAAELAKERLALDRASVITDLEVPKNLAPFVTGDSIETILSSAKALMDTFKVEVQKAMEVKLVSSSDPPVVGDKVDPVNRMQLDSMASWDRVNAMPPGPEKEDAYAALLEAATNLKE